MKKTIFILSALVVFGWLSCTAQVNTYEWEGVGLSFRSTEELKVDVNAETFEYEAACNDFSFTIQLIDREGMDTPVQCAQTLKEMANDMDLKEMAEVTPLEGMYPSLQGCSINGAMEDETGEIMPITLVLLVPTKGDDAFLIQLSYDDDSGDTVADLIRSFNYNDAKNSRKDRE